MKIMFISDIHGSLPAIQMALGHFERKQGDLIVILGDELYHGPRNPLPEGYDPKTVAALLNDYREKILAVRGNCDSEVDQMMLSFPMMADYSRLYVDGISFFLTHGHLYDPEHLPPLASGEVFVYGHYHVPVTKEENGIFYINPNSISLPKQGAASYGWYENGIYRLFDLKTDQKLDEMTLKRSEG